MNSQTAHVANAINRQAFKDNAKKSIDDVFAKIDELEAKKNHVKDSVKESYHKRLSALQEKRKELRSTFHKLENSFGDNWEEAKQEFSQSAMAFKEGVSKLAAVAQ